MTIFKDNRPSSKKKKQVPKLRFSQEQLPLIEDATMPSHTTSNIPLKEEETSSQKKKTVRIPQLKSLQSTNEIESGINSDIDSDLFKEDITDQDKITDTQGLIDNNETNVSEIENEVPPSSIPSPTNTQPLELDENTLNKLKKETEIKIQQELNQLKENQKAEIESELSQYKKSQMHSIDQERETLLNQAKETGLNEGREQGKKELKTQIETIFQHINTAKKLQDKLLQDSEKNILELSVKIAEKIVQKEIKSQKKALVAIIKEAMHKITDKDKVIIKTSPEELQIAQNQFSTIQNLIPDIKVLEIEEDDRIQPGGCIIETKLGFVDSSISTKLDTIKKALLDAYDAKEE